jgi:hypothetical protein
MNFRYLKAMIFVTVCLGMQSLQAMQHEELPMLNSTIAKYEKKARRKGWLNQKDTRDLEAAKSRKEEIERNERLSAAEAIRSGQRQVQLQERRQQEAVQQPSAASQSELRPQASVQTLQQGAGPQAPQQPQPTYSQQPQSRLQHAESQQGLQQGQNERQQRVDAPLLEYASWDEFLQQEIDDLFGQDKTKK